LGKAKRGSNVMRSHVPYVKNGYIIPNMVSKDVRNVVSKEVKRCD
jgi:hypothetical protein